MSRPRTPGAGNRKPWWGRHGDPRPSPPPVSRSSTTSSSLPEAQRRAPGGLSRRPATAAIRPSDSARRRRRLRGSPACQSPGDQLARVGEVDQVPGVREAVAPPERLELVARQAPRPHHRVAGVVGDHYSCRAGPRRAGWTRCRGQAADLATAVIEPSSSRRAHHRRSGSARRAGARASSGRCRCARCPSTARGARRDHGIPAVAASGAGAVAGTPTGVDDSARPRGGPGAGERPCRSRARSRCRRRWRASRSRARAAPGAAPAAPSVSGSSTDTVEGATPARCVAVLHHELAPVEDDERVVRPRHRQAVRGEQLELRSGRWAQQPKTMCTSRSRGRRSRPARRVRRAAAGWRDGGERVRVQSLHPGLHRRGLRAPERDAVAKREQLARLATRRARRWPTRPERPPAPGARLRRMPESRHALRDSRDAAGPPSSHVHGRGQ